MEIIGVGVLWDSWVEYLVGVGIVGSVFIFESVIYLFVGLTSRRVGICSRGSLPEISQNVKHFYVSFCKYMIISEYIFYFIHFFIRQEKYQENCNRQSYHINTIKAINKFMTFYFLNSDMA